MPQYQFTSRSEIDTDHLASLVADVLQPGDVISLEGTLGAGKTRFVQGLAAAVGIPAANVTSPTFVLVNEYRQGRLPIFHFDVYRLRDEDEFLELGVEEYFDSDGVTLVEWGDRVRHLLPPDASRITIELTSTGERLLIVSGPLADRLMA